MEGGRLQPAHLSEVSISAVCWSLYKCLHYVALPHAVNGMAAGIYLLVTEWTCWGLCTLELVYCILKTHFWQSNATIKLVKRLR